jgi:hypothetical protein
MIKQTISIALVMVSTVGLSSAKEIHVGADHPLKTISAAAELAQPGDTITVHAGVYRERVDPPRGGTSDTSRITYQAAPGEKVVITGAEPRKGWENVGGDTWKVVVPNSYFGNFNPLRYKIEGEWCEPTGRHAASVYLNGEWLEESLTLDPVLKPAGKSPLWFAEVGGTATQDSARLLAIKSFDVDGRSVPSLPYASKKGEVGPVLEETCLGGGQPGDWGAYEGIDLSKEQTIAIQASLVAGSCEIEFIAGLGAAEAESLGRVTIAKTGGMQKWKTFSAPLRATSFPANKTLYMLFSPGAGRKIAGDNTTIWAQFPGVNPNDADVEISKRQSIFYPSKTGINDITVRGFELCQAATPWGGAMSEQVGLIGTHWSKGWIIENNHIHHSMCKGVSLGRYELPAAERPPESALAAHLKAGGTVFFSQVTPETIGTVAKLVGKPLRLTDPFFGQRGYCIKAPVSWTRIDTPHQWVDYYDGVLVPYPFEPNYSPLLAGMANIDLEWNGKPMFTNGIEIEGMSPVSPGKDHQILISNWHIGSESTNSLYGEMLNGVRDLRQNTWFVNRDPVLLEVSANGGRALISQLDLSAGGEKSSRVMQTLLTNLGVPFGGASPMPAEKAYAAGGREDQLKRLAAHDTRIAPAKRQFYGTPNPMPDFLVGTNISGSKTAAALPLMGLFGDSVTLGLAGPLTQKLKDVVRMDKPAVLSRSSLAAGEAKAAIGDRKYSRVVFTLGESDLDSQISDADFLKNLEALWKTLAASSEKLYWTPIPSAARPGDAKRSDKAKQLNQISEQFFEGKDVYKVPFIYTKVAELAPYYISGQGESFQPAEAQAIADRLGEAVISFGAQ